MTGFWQGKRVLLTGHTGFVGAWLACVLRNRGAVVTGFSLPEEAGSLYEKIRDHLKITDVVGDLRDPKAIRDCVVRVAPEVVFHLAAFGFVKECYEDPARAYSTNVLGTLNLMQALRGLPHPVRIVVASSDKVYLNDGREHHLFAETDPLGGLDPYSASKTCEDLTARSCYDSYFADSDSSLCVVRPSNILGGGDHIRTRLIPGIFDRLNRGEEPVLRNPESIRPWQHILDMTDAYLFLAEHCDRGIHVYNVGPEPQNVKTVREITEVIMRLYGGDHAGSVQSHSGGGRERSDGEERPASDVKEKAFLGLSIDSIKKELGWKPRKTLEQTLEDTFHFYRQDNGSNTYTLCMSQIQEYEHTEKNGEGA